MRSDFTRLREETFSCGGQSHTVAIYKNELFAQALGLSGNKTDIACEFVLVPEGRFMMGSPDGQGYSDERPQHQVTIQKAFLMARTEVTQAVWDGIERLKHADLEDDRRWRGERLPMERVSWDDIQEFAEATGLRLPSEAEWEYACRAGTTTRFCFGDSDNDLGDYARYRDNSSSKTHPVGEKRPNAFGLFDMLGNVWEWCEDYWHENYVDAPTDGSARTSGESAYRVVRGGSWLDLAWSCRSAYRIGYGYRDDRLGFRPVL